jgi:hypothetical protein
VTDDGGDLLALSERIEVVLDELRASVSGPAWRGVEELVRLLTDLYGAGLARTIELCGPDPGLTRRLAADQLVASLLLLHGLHPDDLGQRVHRAVDALAPVIRSRGGDIESEVDAEAGTVRVIVTLGAAGHGAEAVRDQVGRVLADAAPDAGAVEVEVITPTDVPVRLGPARITAARQPRDAGAAAHPARVAAGSGP